MSSIISDPIGYAEHTGSTFTTKGQTTQVDLQLSRQAAELEQLHGALTELEARLAPVSMPRPEAPDRGQEPREVMAPLAELIAGHSDAVIQAAQRVRSILVALEI